MTVFLVITPVAVLILALLINMHRNKKHEQKMIEEFLSDWGSANTKLRGKLLLFGKHRGDLSKLTFEEYFECLKIEERVSETGMIDFISRSDNTFLLAEKRSFAVAIYLRKLNKVLIDDANTAFTDGVIDVKADSINLKNILKEHLSKAV